MSQINIVRNTYKSAKASTKQPDKLAIDVVEKGTTNRRALVLEGDDVAKFKEANAKGEAQKFLDEIEVAVQINSKMRTKMMIAKGLSEESLPFQR